MAIDPISLAVLSGIGSLFFNKMRDDKAKKSAADARKLPEPLQFNQKEAMQFTALRAGVRVFDREIINSPEISRALANCKVVLADGAPDAQTLRIVPASQASDVSQRTALETIDWALRNGKVVLVTLSVILLEPTGFCPGPVAIVIGSEAIKRLAHSNGAFAVWPAPIPPPVTTAAPAAQQPAPQVVDNESGESDTQPMDAKVNQPSLPFGGTNGKSAAVS